MTRELRHGVFTPYEIPPNFILPFHPKLPGGNLPGVTHCERAREVFAVEMAALRHVQDRLDEAFEAAVEAILTTVKHRGKVVVVGVGKSGNVGQKIVATFNSTGVTSVLLHSADALHGDLGILHDGDLVLALSYSGETEEMVRLLPAIRRFSVKLVSMTGGSRATLAKHSDVVLDVKVPKEACPFNLAPTSSTTAMLVMGDALAMAVLDARGFTREDYARHHPAGAIGRTLLVKVTEIMRAGDRNPVATEGETVRDGLLRMTRCKAGSLSIVDNSGRLAGVFTDGDLRRQLAADPNALDRALKSVMTRKPVCIREDALASEALKIFNERNIDDLVVVNKRRQPVGVVDLQDLPKMKIL